MADPGKAAQSTLGDKGCKIARDPISILPIPLKNGLSLNLPLRCAEAHQKALNWIQYLESNSIQRFRAKR